MQYDEVLKTIGEFGRYQMIKYLLMCLVAVVSSCHALSPIFTLLTPKHRCALPSDVLNVSDSYAVQSEGHAQLIGRYIPRTEDGDFENCVIYDEPGGLNSSTTKCTRWAYDTSTRLDTVVTKMDLVCDRKLYSTWAKTIFMVGNLIGSIISGIIADSYGRRITLLIALLGLFISSIVVTFTTEFYSFLIFKLLAGVFNIQLFVTPFVMGMEIVGPNYRVTAGMIIEIFWALGFLMVIGLAYLIRTETYLHLALTLPIILFTPYYWILPESPRWLIAKGRVSEAKKIISDITKANGTMVSDSILLEDEVKTERESITNILRAKRVMLRCLVIFFNWFVIAMSFYGLSFNSGNMPGSLYVNTLLSAVGEIIGYLLCFLCFVLGRKGPHVAGMILGGLACVISVVVAYLYQGSDQTKNWIFITLNNLGKIGITVGFAVIFLWSAEMFPTGLRNSLMGVSSVFARIGTIMAPVIADIGKIVPKNLSQMLPPLVFGVFSLSAGLLSIALPETNKQSLPETIEEANTFPRKPPHKDIEQELKLLA